MQTQTNYDKMEGNLWPLLYFSCLFGYRLYDREKNKSFLYRKKNTLRSLGSSEKNALRMIENSGEISGKGILQ